MWQWAIFSSVGLFLLDFLFHILCVHVSLTVHVQSWLIFPNSGEIYRYRHTLVYLKTYIQIYMLCV
jgi:hypothetical protein